MEINKEEMLKLFDAEIARWRELGFSLNDLRHEEHLAYLKAKLKNELPNMVESPEGATPVLLVITEWWIPMAQLIQKLINGESERQKIENTLPEMLNLGPQWRAEPILPYIVINTTRGNIMPSHCSIDVGPTRWQGKLPLTMTAGISWLLGSPKNISEYYEMFFLGSRIGYMVPGVGLRKRSNTVALYSCVPNSVHVKEHEWAMPSCERIIS